MTLTETILHLPDDYEGAVQATLLRADSAEPSNKAVLYLHGYIDYFFQLHMAEHFVAEGWNFYALDLRKYGRSLLPHQHAYYCHSLNEYFPEIDLALQAMRQERNSTIVLLGHSTGGLIASLYAARGAERQLLQGLLLNSPFFEFNAPCWKRKIAIPLAAQIGKIFPFASMRNELSPHYYASVHSSQHGEWDFDPKLKPQTGVPLYFAWLGAIRRGQKEIKRGLHLTLPTLVLHSARSIQSNEWTDDYMQADGVLNIEDIHRYALSLGQHTQVVAIEGGMHDLVLSPEPVREEAFRTFFAWLRRIENNNNKQ